MAQHFKSTIIKKNKKVKVLKALGDISKGKKLIFSKVEYQKSWNRETKNKSKNEVIKVTGDVPDF